MNFYLRLSLIAALLGGFCSAVIAAEEEARNEISEARAADTPSQIETSLDVLERLFTGGNYLQARQLCESLLENPRFAPIPPVLRDNIDYTILSAKEISALDMQYDYLNTARAARQLQREMVLLFHARALYEQAVLTNDRALMRSAITEFQRLAQNQYLFSAQQYQAEAAFRAGQGYYWLGDYSQAVTALRRVGSLSPSSDLDVSSRLLLADALKALADLTGTRADDRPGRSPQDIPLDPREALKTREALLREAKEELSKIITNHPQSRNNPDTELRLIELHFELQEYDEAERMAEELLKRATPGSEYYARGSYYRANAVYLQGRIAESADFFRTALDENKNASAAVRADLLYGYGWTNARLADSASPELRQVNLTRAQAALRQAVKLLPFGRRRQEAQVELAKVLIQMQQYREALQYLQEVLAEPSLRTQGNYLAGQAAQGVGEAAQAARYYQAALAQAMREGGGRVVLDALQHLAELEFGEGNFAEALGYYRLAQKLAVEQRQFDIVASASLGMAVAVAEMSSGGEENRELAARRLGEAILQIAAASKDEIAVAEAAQLAAFRLAALQEWSQAGSANLQKAGEILQNLQGRLLPRLREDELMYVQGKVYYLAAQKQRKDTPLAYNVPLSQYDGVFQSYRKAIAVLDSSLVANPRGSVSPRTRYLLGQVYDSYAELKMELAAFLRARGQGAEAVRLEEDGLSFYRQAVGPLSLSVLDAEHDTTLRINARTLLGRSYLALGRFGDDPAQYEKGLEEFRILLSEVAISPQQRIEALRDMATALSQKKRKEEAVTLLLPYVQKDLACAMQAAQILQELKRPRQAYEILSAGVEAALAKSSLSPMLAKAQYLMRKMGLDQAPEIVRTPGDVAALQMESASGLLQLSENYPGTEWASFALLDLGKWLLGQGKWEEAQRRARAGIAKLRENSRAVDTVQALYLLAGRALLAGGMADASQDLIRRARADFQMAERASTTTDLGREQRAAAIREQGNTYLALGDKQEALRYYGRVFSIFFNQYEQADLARIEAAKIHAGAGNYDLALNILDAGFDQDMLLQYKMLYRQKDGK